MTNYENILDSMTPEKLADFMYNSGAPGTRASIAAWLEAEVDSVLEFTDIEKTILAALNDKYNYIARDKNGDLYVFMSKPHRFANFWTTEESACCAGMHMFKHHFKTVSWENEEPCEFRRCLRDAQSKE